MDNIKQLGKTNSMQKLLILLIKTKRLLNSGNVSTSHTQNSGVEILIDGESPSMGTHLLNSLNVRTFNSQIVNKITKLL